MYKCSKCHSREIERSVWIDMQTEQELPGDTTYFCRSCGALVDVIKIEEDESNTIDSESTAGNLAKPFGNEPWYDADEFNSNLPPTY